MEPGDIYFTWLTPQENELVNRKAEEYIRRTRDYLQGLFRSIELGARRSSNSSDISQKLS